MSTQLEQHNAAVDRLIDAANRLHNESDADKNLISAGLMTACGLYGAFLHAQLNHMSDDEGQRRVERLRERLTGQHEGLAKCADHIMVASSRIRKDLDMDQAAMAAAQVAASGVYASFAYAGNQGYLRPGGVDKVTEKYGELLGLLLGEELDDEYRRAMIATYHRNLQHLQEMKKRELREQGLLDEDAGNQPANDPETPGAP